MTTKRMVQLRVQPLTHIELVNALSSKDPVYREEEEAFLSEFFDDHLYLNVNASLYMRMFVCIMNRLVLENANLQEETTSY